MCLNLFRVFESHPIPCQIRRSAQGPTSRLKSDSEKLVTRFPGNLDGKGKKDPFWSHANVIEYIHSKSIPAFQLALGDMFRA